MGRQGEGLYQSAYLFRPYASLEGLLVTSKHAFERRPVLDEPFGRRLVVESTEGAHVAGGGVGAYATVAKPALVAAQGLGVEGREGHVPAAVEADERAHGRAVIVRRGAADDFRCCVSEDGKCGRGTPLFTALPCFLYFLFLVSVANGTCAMEPVRSSEIR